MDESLTLRRVAKFPKAFPEQQGNEEKAGLQPEGGTFRNGEYGWLSAGSYLEIVEMNSGFKVSRFDFASQFGNSFAQISTIVDLELSDFSTPVLAIGFRTDSTDSGFICLFSVHGSRPLEILQFPDSVSILHSLLSPREDEDEIVLYRDFDGCLIVGFDSGKTAIIDLNVRDLQQRLLQTRREFTEPVPCVTIPSDASEEEIRKCHKEAHRQNCGFGLDLKVLEDAGPVLSLLPLPQMSTLAVGLCDGRLVLYHLDGNMEAYHLALPPEPMSPLVAMAFMEPADDPKACAYLWAFHETPEMAIAVMHSLVFESRRTSSTRDTIYDRFQSCRVRLTMPIQDRGSVPISCQSICQPLSSSEESLTCVCLLAWRTERKTSMLMVFDLNQWYKEQMPWVGNWRDMPRYVAIFPMNEDPLSVRMDSRSLSWFNSLDRPEEHFYPTAMGFDCLLLTYKGSYRYHWPGLQTRALNMLEYCGPNAILEPDMCYRAMLNATLVPQFSEENFKLDSTLAKKRELLLSIALEYNCVGLLKRCARVWADGSHMGRDPSKGLSLATLTDWIWSRSLTIKQYCNTMCVPLFDYSGRQLGTAEQKRLSHCGVQLKWLSEIMDMIMTTCNQYIPEDILDQLKDQQKSIQIAAEYQEVLVWMFNMGLLPECNGTTLIPSSLDSSVASSIAGGGRSNVSMVYPYELLNNFYHQKREQFFEADRKYVQNAPNWNSCSMLYIDALLDKECGGVRLYRDWREDGGSGLYPPRSLQSMLRVLLLPNVSIQSKYAIFMYLYMDLNVVYQDHECHALVQNLYKFPTAFKMPKDMIKLIESFWHLDHNNFEEAVVDLKASSMTKWQLELMVECLFLHQWPHLSLRALQMPGPSISPVIEMRVLLGNNLISEAFLFQKKHGDKTLLLEFFNSCFKLGSLRSILKLPLTETEGQLLGEFLLSVDASMPRNLHFVYLLQRSKYVEAVDLVESLRLKKIGGSVSSQNRDQQLDTGSVNAVLSTYKATMPPIYQEMSDIYKKTGQGSVRSARMSQSMSMSMDQSGNQRMAMATPLSSQLIRNKVDVNSSVYQMAITAVKEATNYSLFQGHQQSQNQSMRSPNKFTSIPFLRKPLQETMYDHEASVVIYPTIVEGNTESKRKTHNDPEADENFAKRRKLEDINTGLLTSFQPTKVDRMPDFSVGRSNNKSSVLTTPIVKRVAQQNNANVSPTGGKMTPHSILKARNIFRDSPGPDEKILRFKHSVSPSIFDVSAIKKPHEQGRPSTSARPFDGPKARRSIRSVTPDDNIMSSTRNQIDVDETTVGRPPAARNDRKLFDLEEEIKNKMSAVAAEELQMARTKDVSTSRTYSPKREIRPQSPEERPEVEVPVEEEAEVEEVPKKLPPIAPRRSLRSRTPEQVSPRTTAGARSATKKTLTRMVLESNAKKNLMMGRQEEEIPEAMEEDSVQENKNSTLDSTLAMSDYSLNLEVDPLAGDKTILQDNSCVSDSMLGEWRERLRGQQQDNTNTSFMSDTSEVPSMGDALVDTPNQSLQFVSPEQVSINRTLEEEMEEKLTEVDHLKEDTVYQPQEVEVTEEVPEDKGPETEQEEIVTHLVPVETTDGFFKVPTPPKSHKESKLLPYMINQDTFIVPSKEEEAKEELMNKPAPRSMKFLNDNDVEEDSPEDDYYDESESSASNKSQASNEDLQLENDFPASDDDEDEAGLNDAEDYEEGDSDPSDSYSDDEDESDEGPVKDKPFKTNEVIELLDSDDEEEEGGDVKAAASDVSDESEENNARLAQNDTEEDEEEDNNEGVEEYVPAHPVTSVDYGATFDIGKQGATTKEEEEKEETTIGDLHRDESPEQMDQDDEPQEMVNIYDDMDVDVVGDDVDVEKDTNDGLNDAMMDEGSKDTDMCLRIDEDSRPEEPTIVADEESSENTLDKAVVMEETVAMDSDAVEQEEVIDVAEKEEVDRVEVELREEVIEVVPQPKIAYQTTEEEKPEEEIVVEGEQEVIEAPVSAPELIQEEEPQSISSPEILSEPQPAIEQKPEEKIVETVEKKAVDEPIPEVVEEIVTPQEEQLVEKTDPVTPEVQMIPSKSEEEMEVYKEVTPPQELITKPTYDLKQVPAPQEQPPTQSEETDVESPMPSTQPEPSTSQASELDHAASESSQPEKLTARRRSVRAASQPRNSLAGDEQPARIKTRRATSEAVENAGPIGAIAVGTPKRERRNSHLFEQTTSEERLTPNLRMTPMRLARMNESTENLTTGTPTRRNTRATSIESEAGSVRTPTTRGTRGRSKVATTDTVPEEEDDNVSVASNTSRRSLRGRRSVTADNDDDAKSTVSTSSVASKKGSTAAARAKKTLMDTAIPEEPEVQDYSTSRRLTRNQEKMMERSMQVQNRMLDVSSSTISPGTPPVDESADSDGDSVSSKVSRASQKRRSLRGVSKESDVSESGASTRSARSTRMKPPTAAKKKLNAIIEAEGKSREDADEEDPSAAGDSTTTPPKKRGRPKAQK